MTTIKKSLWFLQMSERSVDFFRLFECFQAAALKIWTKKTKLIWQFYVENSNWSDNVVWFVCKMHWHMLLQTKAKSINAFQMSELYMLWLPHTTAQQCDGHNCHIIAIFLQHSCSINAMRGNHLIKEIIWLSTLTTFKLRWNLIYRISILHHSDENKNKRNF